MALELVDVHHALRPDGVDHGNRAGDELLVAVLLQPIQRRARGAAAVEAGDNVTSTSWSASCSVIVLFVSRRTR